MNLEDAPKQPADAGPVERPVRPRAEAQTTLCTACAKHFAWCKSAPTFAATSDAVVACTSFEAARLVGWKCHFCDYRGNGQYDTFCGNCRRHK